MSKISSPSQSTQQLKVAFWNLQNLFDIDVSAIATDLEYTPVNGWDRRAFEVKVTNLAEVINQMFDGSGPDLLGICEIENERVAQILMEAIGRTDYRLAHVEHPDIRGIDTSLIYSADKFELDETQTAGHLVHLRFPTRDIFEVQLKVKANDANLKVLVNHWPSRSRGRLETEPYRLTVASHCGRLVDQALKLPRREYLTLKDNEISLHQLNQRWEGNVLVMGDLNDEPWNRSVMDILKGGFSVDQLEEPIRFSRGCLPSYKSYAGRTPALFNPMWALMQKPDQGTLYFSRATHSMNMLDQFLFSRGLYFGLQGLKTTPTHLTDEGEASVPFVEIFKPDCMTTRKGRPREFRKENRSGYSDHFPIVTTLDIIQAT